MRTKLLWFQRVSEGAVIRYTGNPYVDAGVAILELRLGKPCDEFTLADLEAQAMEIKQEYTKKIWKKYLRLHLPNSAWTQKDPSSATNQEYVRKTLESYKPGFAPIDRRCPFCCRPAKILADGRYVPLLTGETIMTSGAGGAPGLPICGYCVFAVHFYPLATLRVNGKALFWWAPDPRWTRRLNKRFYYDVQRILVASPEEFVNLKWPATQLLRAARQVVDEIEELPTAERPLMCDVVGIHATNDRRRPSFDELRIPRGLLEFWSEAGAWELYREIEREAWESEPSKTQKRKPKSARRAGTKIDAASFVPDLAKRNKLYEALGEAFRSPDYQEKAKQIAARFFLRRRGTYVAPNTTALAEFFLVKVANMDVERLDAIRDIADAIASAADSKWLIDKLMRSGRSLYDYLPVMRMVQQKVSSQSRRSSIPWEKFLLALNLVGDEDATGKDAWLVSELVLIRVFETLSTQRPDLLAQVELPTNEETS
jgi:CRISPR-associated protein Cst1